MGWQQPVVARANRQAPRPRFGALQVGVLQRMAEAPSGSFTLKGVRGQLELSLTEVGHVNSLLPKLTKKIPYVLFLEFYFQSNFWETR